jgi:hypothetical protein
MAIRFISAAKVRKMAQRRNGSTAQWHINTIFPLCPCALVPLRLFITFTANLKSE